MYSVVWSQTAVKDLAEIWTRGDSEAREAITRANAALAQRLQEEPFEASESREGNNRVIFMAPLGVLFQVDVEASRVRVDHVWQFQPPRRRS